MIHQSACFLDYVKTQLFNTWTTMHIHSHKHIWYTFGRAQGEVRGRQSGPPLENTNIVPSNVDAEPPPPPPFKIPGSAPGLGV